MTAVLGCLQALLGEAAPFSPGARDGASFPLHMGGLGLRSAHAHRAAAYWASWADTLPALRQHWPPVADRVAQLLMGEARACPPSVAEAIQAAAHLRRVGFEPPPWPALLAGAPGRDRWTPN